MKFSKMKKDDLELMSYKDITFLILEEYKELNTAELFNKIKEKLEMTDKEYEAKIADYYMMLSTDKRFILLDNGNWDLGKRHKSDKVIDIEDDEDDENIDEEEEIKDKSDYDEEDDIDNYDKDNNDDEFDDDSDDSLGDLVIVDDDELELEQ